MTHSGRLEGTVSLVISTKDKRVGLEWGLRGEALEARRQQGTGAGEKHDLAPSLAVKSLGLGLLPCKMRIVIPASRGREG